MSSTLFENIFSHSAGCLFLLFMIFFTVQKLLSLIRSHLFIFASVSITLGDRSKKLLLQFMSKSVLPMRFSRSFIVSGLTFRSLIHFECIFVYGVRECSNLIFYRFCFSIPLIRETIFSLLHIFVSFVKDK